MNTEQTKNVVHRLIDEGWNQGNLAVVDTLVAEHCVDHSLPPQMTGREGMKQWIAATGKAFEHKTIIEDQVTEGATSMLRVRMDMKHIGDFRGIPATGKTATISGYRTYRVENGQIVEHWALIDGASLAEQLRPASA